MIKINHLTKIYNKDEKSVVALNNISFTLEDSGFVFITGKSGCGKSTLLNILGGLDNATSGEVLCNGKDLTKFSVNDFDNYRNAYLGFIFQDYCLVEDLNVAENILLALNLQGSKYTKEIKDKMVDDALTSVDLDISLKNRYVRELSGGQKQRVAIARALVKSPKLILSDEPTGNLDSKTSAKILKLLKKLSKDRLVVIVSHNLDDAKKYGDRIIELSDGEIISDTTRYEDSEDQLSISRGILHLPHSKQLTNNELKLINEKLKDNKVRKIRQNKTGFRKTKIIKYDEPAMLELEHHRMNFSNSFKLSKAFLRKRKMASILTTITISVLIFILGLCQFFMEFKAPISASELLQQSNETDLLLYNGYYNNENNKIVGNRCIELSDKQLSEFENSGYEGNIYKLYLTSFGFAQQYGDGAKIVEASNFDKYYIRETRGTLQCDEEYLIKRFGKDGKLDYVGNLTDKDHGIILTDYIMDSMFYTYYKAEYDYQYMVGDYLASRKYVNAIIKTDYKEKYADLFKYIQDTSIGIDRSEDEEHYKQVMQQFTSDVLKYYGVAYTINPNFEEAIKAEKPFEHTYLNFGEFKTKNVTISFDDFILYTRDTFNVRVDPVIRPEQPFPDQPFRDPINAKFPPITPTLKPLYVDYTLKDYEIAMEYDIYNNLFGSIYGTYTEEDFYTFEPITLTLNKYDGTDDKNIIYSKEVTIAKLLPTEIIDWTSAESEVMFGGAGLINLISPHTQFAYGLYFDDVSGLDKIYNIINFNPYTVQSRTFSSIKTVGDIVQIFIDLFGIVLFAIAAVSLMLLVNFAYGNIKKRYFEIGVLKALGSTTKNIGFIFGLQTLLVGISISLISTLLLWQLTPILNNIIVSKMIEFVGNKALNGLIILETNTSIMLINILTITFITILTCIIPLLKLRKIKPKNIIVNRD